MGRVMRATITFRHHTWSYDTPAGNLHVYVLQQGQSSSWQVVQYGQVAQYGQVTDAAPCLYSSKGETNSFAEGQQQARAVLVEHGHAMPLDLTDIVLRRETWDVTVDGVALKQTINQSPWNTWSFETGREQKRVAWYVEYGHLGGLDEVTSRICLEGRTNTWEEALERSCAQFPVALRMVRA